MNVLETFIAPDRRWALANDATLDDRAFGAVLFVDVSGFTPLTEAMTRMLGARRGAEELTTNLNRVYDALIAEIEAYGGNVVTFAGDAALGWFAQSRETVDASLRATACAFALQRAMERFSAVPLPDGSTTALEVKVTVATGEVRRFVVGDPAIRLMDVLAGSTVARTATAEHLAQPGEILADGATVEMLGTRAGIGEWRTDPAGGERFAVLKRLDGAVPHVGRVVTPILSDAQLVPWSHRAVYERMRVEGEAFLTELRPVVAMFVRFHGIDFDGDNAAGVKLNQFVGHVQRILERYEGTLLELTVGDKGSYFYSAFGALYVHEDDAHRAASAAREMFPLCEQLGFIEPLQIGISQGVMRVGGYGGRTRRMYGAQGDEVNLAARLMVEAQPGTVLVSGRIQQVIADEFDLEPLPPIRPKGKREPLLPYTIQGLRSTRAHEFQETSYALPLIGRERELELLLERMELAQEGQGQVVGITATAGMGKSRLVSEVVRAARRKQVPVYGGECQSFGTNISYLVWAPILYAFFGLDVNVPTQRRLRTLRNQLQELAPERLEAMPLLEAVLGMPIPETEFTRSLEPEFRKSALHALLLDCVWTAAQEARAENQLLLFIIEDAHWIDPASAELVQALAASIETLPVLLILNYRLPENEAPEPVRLRTLLWFQEIRLPELSQTQGEGLIQAKLAQQAPEAGATVSQTLVAQVLARAQGNPFYIEQLLDYLQDRGIDLRDAAAAEALELPSTLHQLVLSRMDRLPERQQLLLKVASIIGRWFTLAHLCGYFPQVGPRHTAQEEFARLQNFDFMLLEHPEPEVAYLFKHIVTHQVAYESLSFATRAALHESYAFYLETHDDPARTLDLLAYHYDHSDNLPKRREYLTRAGEAAAARFANVEAVDYITRALKLVPAEDAAGHYALLMARERVLDVQGERERQRTDLAVLELLAKRMDDPAKSLRVMVGRGWLAERVADHATAARITREMRELLEASELPAQERGVLAMEMELLEGVMRWQQGAPVAAMPHLQRALELAEAAGERVGKARALSFLGNVYREAGDLIQARACYLEQLPLAREIHDVRREWSALNNLGLIANARGEFETALGYYDEALRIVREIGDRLGEGLLLSNLALTEMDAGAYERAQQYGEQALAVARAIDDRRGVSRILLNLGETRRLSGDFENAARQLRQAAEMALELGDQMVWDYATMDLAALEGERENFAEARRLVEEALPTARNIEHRDGEGFLLNTLGQVELAEGNLDAAERVFLQARAIWDALEPSVYVLDTYAGLAEISWGRGDKDAARRAVEAILAFLDERPALRGAPSALNAALAAWRVLEGIGDSRAGTVIAEARAALQERAATFGDEGRRRAFLENIRTHRLLNE